MTCRQTGSDLNVIYGNFFSGGESAPTTPIYVRSSFESPGGVLTELTCNGSNEAQVNPGSIVRFAGPGLSLNVGDSFAIRTFVRVGTNGDVFPMTNAGSYTGMWEVAGDQRLTSGTPPGTTNTFSGDYGPLAVEAETYDVTTPCTAIIGDSIVFGQNDSYSGYTGSEPSNAGPGPFRRAFDASSRNYTMLAVVGSRINWLVDPSKALPRQLLLTGCTSASVMMGSNDLAGGRTAAQVLADYQKIIIMLRMRGIKKIIFHTIMPRASSSTDSYTTLGGQVIPSWVTGSRVTVNNAIRAGIPGADGYAEIADLVESSRDSGYWAVNGTANWMTSDGSHPMPAGYIAASAGINVSLYT